MFKPFVLLLALGVVWGFPERHRFPSGRIVGGEDADIADYPYQLALLLFNQHYCGAALIAPQWALTAAHCVDHGLYDTLSVRAGSSSKSSGGQVVGVSNVIIHQLYDQATANYDYAVLELAEAVTAENASAIDLPEPNSAVEADEVAVVTGWGTLEYNGTAPEILQVVEVPVVSQEDCKQIYGNLLTEAMFCAGLLEEGGKDACQGDSGGPLAIDGRLAGIVSWGSNGCAAPNRPGVYADVGHVVDWVQDIISGVSPSPGPWPSPPSPGPGPSPPSPGPEPSPGPWPSPPSPGPEPSPGPWPSPPSPGPGPSPPSPGPEPSPGPWPSPPSPGPEPSPPSPPSPEPSIPTPGPKAHFAWVRNLL